MKETDVIVSPHDRPGNGLEERMAALDAASQEVTAGRKPVSLPEVPGGGISLRGAAKLSCAAVAPVRFQDET